ncbi:GNAT family N-acetyltransferase [Sedimentitalea sp. JM2-8]|uniref:GNAT family N-acetyltransferase n=1 Tax=Sedimentitalea xiamensis TaxID=3050037 RepID=A0ABT7FKJ3_9RHOB|nr:GNAT family N-acetyltransferase [Sedimentitalea xiamensis]MDK3075540.1 GNAT family N-acetyltransferase [Sedimentitalea xiamensis]
MTSSCIEAVSPDAPDVRALLDRHLALMQAQTPPESCHALPSEALKSDDIVLFGLRENGTLQGVGALKRYVDYGEIKSMHTFAELRGRGVARKVLGALLAEARAAGLRRVFLETGSGPEHAAARALYASAGFVTCGPFGDYSDDPLSHFMTLTL